MKVGMVHWWNDTAVLGEIPVPVPLCSPLDLQSV